MQIKATKEEIEKIKKYDEFDVHYSKGLFHTDNLDMIKDDVELVEDVDSDIRRIEEVNGDELNKTIYANSDIRADKEDQGLLITIKG